MAFTKVQALQMLKTLNCTKVVILYNGGNDEGHIENITFHKEDGTTEQVYEEYNDEFHQVLCSPIYDKYGSFDGDYSVNGTLIWDVKAGTITDEGDETIPTTKPFSETSEIEEAQ
jgi:hypothetical protein